MTGSGLIYYPDTQAGIRRQRKGRGFSFLSPDGDVISDPVERKRIDALAVPPAYEDVWICPVDNGHLQATGRDARGRKQYRYHPDWTHAQSQTKFEKLADFGALLPRIRRRIRSDLHHDAGERDFALAAAARLIDKAALRVGNKTYTEENGSYGALTLRCKHLSLSDNRINLRFKAKGGKLVRRQVADRTLARALEDIGDLPGGALLTWIDDAGEPQTLGSDALNAYLSTAAGDEDVTAKTFRTWSGTLAAFEVAESGNATIKEMAGAAAAALHNTPTIARNSYIHPAVIALAGEPAPVVVGEEKVDLKVAEQRLLGFLQSLKN